MRESKLKPLTATEKKSAEENHNIIYAFLKQYGYSIEEHYSIAVFGYLKGIQAYHRRKDLAENYDLFFICWQYMRAEMGNHFRMENTMKRKPTEMVLSLDAEYSEMESLYNCIGGKSLEAELMEREALAELLENLSEVQQKIARMKEEFGLTYSEGKVTTTSLKVAEIYDKEHQNVMKKIRSFIELIPEINGVNFNLVEYTDAKGESRPMYDMDRQGFSMLVNKFTGDKATIFTYKYTLAFERLVELVEMLSEENQELYQIAVSDNCQLERQYEADKIKYAIRNIERILSSVKYTEMEGYKNKEICVVLEIRPATYYREMQRMKAVLENMIG